MSSCRGGAGLEAKHSRGDAAVRTEGYTRGVCSSPPGADTGHRRGDAGAGPAPAAAMGSLCRTCRGPSQAWSRSTALQSPS